MAAAARYNGAMSDGPRFLRAYPPAAPAPGPALYLPFRGDDLVVREDHALLTEPAPPPAGRNSMLYLGTLDGVPCLAYALPADVALPEGVRAVGLRSLYGNVGDAEYALAGYAAQIVHWQEDHRFCYHCGNSVRGVDGTWGKECTVCGRAVWPPVVPAVLALVHDGGDRVLLAQKSGWGTRYSILAGFVEPGETFEGCVIREVREESGVDVAEPIYDGSQSWPFPHQIMVGFTCRHVAGEIRIDEAELSHAAWFRYDDLPDLPPPLSLSRQIIDRWIASRQRG